MQKSQQKCLMGAAALSVMGLLAQAQDKPGEDKTGSIKPAPTNASPARSAPGNPVNPPPAQVIPAQEKKEVKSNPAPSIGPSNAPGEKDKSAPQKPGSPAPGDGKPVTLPAVPMKDLPMKGESPKPGPGPGDRAKPSVPPRAASADWEKLQGEWTSVNFEYEGINYPSPDRWTLVFEKVKEKVKEKEVIKWKGNVPTMVFWTGDILLNGGRNPCEITLVQPALIGERLQRGIYWVDGDKLTVCWAAGFDAPRPENFAAPVESQLLLTNFVRKKPLPEKK